MVIDDGSPTARRGLRLAIRIGRARGQSLIVFIVADDAVAAAEIQDNAAGAVPDDVPVEFTPLVPAAPETLQFGLRAATGGLLIAGADGFPASAESLDEMIAAAACPVVLLRPTP